LLHYNYFFWPTSELSGVFLKKECTARERRPLKARSLFISSLYSLIVLSFDDDDDDDDEQHEKATAQCSFSCHTTAISARS
jgi:hypothetical protein